MLRPWLMTGAGLVVLAGLVGCGASDSRPTFEIKEISGLDEAKQILKGYADGNPMGSEEENFPGIIEKVRKTDPKKADVLQKGFADLKRTPEDKRPARAKELLAKLGN